MKEIIESYLSNHKSKYIGQYHLLNTVKVSNNEYKFRYYTRDDQFRDTHVFVTVTIVDDNINAVFSIDLNEQEKEYILKDALEKFLLFLEHKTLLHSNVFEVYIKNNQIDQLLEPQDYRNILDYLQYHDGINKETTKVFFDFFMPYINTTLSNKSYENTLDALLLYFDKIMYEYEWDGNTQKYLDYQYNLHMPYIKNIFELVTEVLEEIINSNKNELIQIFEMLLNYPRFIMQFINIYPIQTHHRKQIGLLLKDELIKIKCTDDNVKAYFISFLTLEAETKKKFTVDIISNLLSDFIMFANIDMQRDVCDAIIKEYGHEILIDFFSKQYNTFVFSCFEISTFPNKYKTIIKNELIKAIRYYIGKMEHPNYKQSSFEQVVNINRLLLENYEEYRNEKN